MDCKNCKNNIAKDKEGYMFCEKSLLNQCKVVYDYTKEEFICSEQEL